MSEDQIALSYGRGHMPLALPTAARPTMIRKRPLPKLPDPAARSRRRSKIRSARSRWRNWRATERSACILICDITRPVPNRLFLRPMIETMVGGRHSARPHHGAGRDRPAPAEPGRRTGRARRRSLGAASTCGSRIISPATMPTTSISAAPHTRGTPVKLDRRFVEADLRIATGLVEPHFMAGWSGGRKVVAPGVAASRDHPHLPFRPLHGGSARRPVQSRRQSAARGAARDRAHARRDLCAQHGDRRGSRSRLRRPSAKSSRAIWPPSPSSTAATRDHGRPRKFKTVVTSSAGYPLDKTYYQTVKGMVTPLDILEPGGTLIIASRMFRGLRLARNSARRRRSWSNSGPSASWRR